MGCEEIVLNFAKEQASYLSVDLVVTPAEGDGFRIARDGDIWRIVGNNARSCLWGVYHLQDGGEEGEFRPRFSVRGINPCEALARHTPEQIERLIDRMGRWRFNTLIIHSMYGYKFHEPAIRRLCAERGIEIVYYTQTGLAFFEGAPTSLFARDEAGKPLTLCFDNETRPCPSNKEALDRFRQGAKDYFASDRVENGSKFLFMDADGYLFCRCPACCQLGPVEQFQRLFRIAVEEAVKSGKDISMQHLTYVWRYNLPRDISVFENVQGVMFDTHQRYRWRALGEDHEPNVGSEKEAQVDSRAKEVSFNRYLLDRLGEWRNAFKGTLYVFENLMIQGSVSCPQPYTPQLIQDMDIFEDLGIDGTVYEAFEPGMESFAEQIGVLARAMWSGDIAYEPTALERLCQIPGNAKLGALGHITTDRFDPIAALREHMDDDILIEYAKRLRKFLADSSSDNFRHMAGYAAEHRDRLDWMFIASLYARLVPRQQWPALNEQQKEFLTVTKLWDLQEKMTDPIRETGRIIESFL